MKEQIKRKHNKEGIYTKKKKIHLTKKLHLNKHIRSFQEWNESYLFLLEPNGIIRATRQVHARQGRSTTFKTKVPYNKNKTNKS